MAGVERGRGVASIQIDNPQSLLKQHEWNAEHGMDAIEDKALRWIMIGQNIVAQDRHPSVEDPSRDRFARRQDSRTLHSLARYCGNELPLFFVRQPNRRLLGRDDLENAVQ